ncbi:SCO0930 family lipoprotein [Actinomadura sp. NBRC 104412]|uniref:SCO0930 family lipoprotein n=1 Tax=Actinomadura sp. NBRC 104412 TaxID=3032203 RepID=UPI0025532F6B|nr:SCO0930 family lipoprotein [Actinomadura sp. NBRC 104412]
MGISRWGPWTAPVVAVLAASAIVLTACGNEGSGGRLNARAGTNPSAAPSQPPLPSPAAVPTALEVASVGGLGRVVTDRKGRTLYRFDKDTARPPASTCVDACAKAWPPVPAGDGAVQVKGVDEDLVGKVRRPDGQWQVTLAGWPLYTYAKDRRPGDAKGQGVGGAWYAARPDGKKAAPPPARKRPQREGGDRRAGWTVVKVRRDPRLGMIVTDGAGRVMYRFDRDRPRTTTCFGACRRAWPPVIFTSWSRLRVEGVDRRLVGFIEREDDGRCQLTIAGHPMYHFAGDDRPGDTEGQGVQNVWWVVSPRGERVITGTGGPDHGGGRGGRYGY